MKKETWITITNSSECKVFSIKGKKRKLLLVTKFHFPEARIHAIDLVNSIHSGTHEGASLTKRTIEPKLDPHCKEKLEFSHIVADFLNKEAYEHKFNNLILISSPEFLGYIRKLLNKHAHSVLTKEIDKDLIYATTEEIFDHIYV